ncbi:MAG: hypothetical protein ACYC7E_14830 [Armatimonadota bacterium]
MDIGRVEPELIIPAEASERGAKVVLDRHPAGYRQQEKQRHSVVAPDEDEEGGENGAGMTPTYDQEGHVQEGEQQTAEVRYIDFTA